MTLRALFSWYNLGKWRVYVSIAERISLGGGLSRCVARPARLDISGRLTTQSAAKDAEQAANAKGATRRLSVYTRLDGAATHVKRHGEQHNKGRFAALNQSIGAPMTALDKLSELNRPANGIEPILNIENVR